MESKDYLAYLVEEIHTTVVATVDDAGLPVTAAIDMMDADEGDVYFLTARGKGFYDRLKKRGVLALTGMKGLRTPCTVLRFLFGERCVSLAVICCPGCLKRIPI